MADVKNIDIRMDEIRKQQKQLQFISIFCPALLIAIIVLFMFRNRAVVIVSLFAFILFYLFWYRKQKRQYSDRIAEVQILYGLCGTDPSAQYLGSKGLSLGEFEQFHLLPIRHDEHALMLRQGFTCTEKRNGKGFQVNGWEITFHYEDDRGRNNYQFLSGTLLRIQPQEPLQTEELLLFREDLLSEHSQRAFLNAEGYSSISLPDGLSASGIGVYSAMKADLSEEHTASLLSLFETIPSLGALRISSGLMVLYLKNRFYTIDIKGNVLPARELLKENPLPELTAVLDLCQAL